MGLPGQADTGSAKLGEPLQQRMLEWDDSNQDGPLNCFMQLHGGPDAQQLHEIEQTGLELVSITESILAVRGFPDAIKQAAELDYVDSINLRQIDNP
ncbi:MAG: hypothetical protein WEB89_07005 [Balneolales bacterium]